MEILLHVSVRWLSLEHCVTRILRQYGPLASYFKSASMSSYPFYYIAPIKFRKIMSCNMCDMHNLLSLFIDEKQPRFRRLEEAFSDPMTEVYLLFFQATIPAFTCFNLLLQREQSSVFLLHDEVQGKGGICCCCTAVCACFHSAVHLGSDIIF